MDALTRERAEQLLPVRSTLRALVIGDLMVDRYVTGTVDRVSPEAPVPIVQVQDERTAVGGAGNVAANLAALGLATTVVGCIGTDGEGEIVRAAMKELGVSLDGILVSPNRRTTLKTRVMAGHQQIVRFDHEVTVDLAGAELERTLSSIETLVPLHDVVVIEDYNKGVLTPRVIDTTLRCAAAGGIPTVVDPKRRNFFSFGGATVFKPNAKELEDALGEEVRPHDADWMEGARERLGCRHLVLTLGHEGIALQSEGGEPRSVPAVARAVFDVSGAGDTVSAVVAAVLAARGSPVEASILANHAAAVCVTRAGVVPVSRDEVLQHLTR